MSEINMTKENVETVKHVLFGLQKQANVTNDAVVKIVTRGVCAKEGSAVLYSEDAFIDACRHYLQECVNNEHSEDDTVIMLLAGEQSLANLKKPGPKVVYVEQPNPESPKHIFRINMLGQEPESVDMSVDANITAQPSPAGVEIGSDAYNSMTCYEKACALRDAILPLAPTAVRAEIDDDFALALYCSEAYFRAKM